MNQGTADTEVSVLLDAAVWAEGEGLAGTVGPGRVGVRPGNKRQPIRDRVLLARKRCAGMPRGVPGIALTGTSAGYAMGPGGCTSNAPGGASW